ncbi:hypothetical protein IV203_025976 [Nitzschia inconspicua]|uniref:Uncharacterized protein n=1 Tax=Nitzschia inconspicua TaxID=303405 RepID=A0A9K3LI97_9STRA|nr:hypothetical protein IV203_025976 [Nitzschia inconspicua]
MVTRRLGKQRAGAHDHLAEGFVSTAIRFPHKGLENALVGEHLVLAEQGPDGKATALNKVRKRRREVRYNSRGGRSARGSRQCRSSRSANETLITATVTSKKDVGVHIDNPKNQSQRIKGEAQGCQEGQMADGGEGPTRDR